MKRIVSILILLLALLSKVNAELSVYVSDSGHKFYYIASGYDLTKAEVGFVNAQDLYVDACVLGPCDEDEVKQAAEEAFKEVVRVVYNQNKDYMWSHFPEHKYSFEEVYKIIRKLAWKRNIHHLDGSFECAIELEIGFIPSPGMEEKIEKYPYIMGYIYKEVKRYTDGTPCEVQMPKF